MRLALVTTPPSVRSGIGDYTRHLMPHLREHVDLTVFVADELAGEDHGGFETRAASSLVPREYDQILFQLGNEITHGFMAPMVRALGGIVCLHDWVLFDMALAAWPELAHGGLRGHWLALREGGSENLACYRANRQARRRACQLPVEGWYAPESEGRWTADGGVLRLPAGAPGTLRLRLRGAPGSHVQCSDARGTVLGEVRLTDAGSVAELALDVAAAEVSGTELVLRTTGPGVLAPDGRRLGCFVVELAGRGPGGWSALPLEVTGARVQPIDLARDRFDLALNRSIVRFADGFFVHSDALGYRIIDERNAPTPIGVLPHGAQPRWSDSERTATRAHLGLAGWESAFLLTSFGAVQGHKRVDVLLEGLARARATGQDLRLVLIGHLEPEHYDPLPTIARHGLGDVVHTTGYVPEERAWEWIHAGDLAVQLRGPSTGGTSGGIFQSLALGRGVIASRTGEQAELPESCVLQVAHGEHEVRDLAQLLCGLAQDPAQRADLETGAREFVRDECCWERVAARYVEALELLPRPRSSKKRFLFDRIRQGVKERQG